jgi:large subunit ribosomal protein L25
VVGEAAPDTLVTVDLQTLEVEVAATDIPEVIEVSVEGVEAGTQVLAGTVPLPEGATLVTDPEALVVNVTTAITSEALEAELAEAEAEAGIEHDAPAAPEGAEAAEAPAEQE